MAMYCARSSAGFCIARIAADKTRQNAHGTDIKSHTYRALRRSKLKEMYIVRYADDFKIFCRSRQDAEKAFEATRLYGTLLHRLVQAPVKYIAVRCGQRLSEYPTVVLTSEQQKHKPKQSKIRYTEYYDLQSIFDSLYADSLNGKTFQNLMRLIASEENIKLAYRTIKGNKGSGTPGVDKRTIKDLYTAAFYPGYPFPTSALSASRGLHCQRSLECQYPPHNEGAVSA